MLFCGVGFVKIFHGAGRQMTNDGTGVYYKPYLPLSVASQIISDIGFHFESSMQHSSMFIGGNKKRSIFLNIMPGYQRKLFTREIGGIFQPVIIIQGGGVADKDSFSWVNILGDWMLIYAAGVGVQFYNGRKLNEIMLKINKNTNSEWGMAIQLAIYWEKGE